MQLSVMPPTAAITLILVICSGAMANTRSYQHIVGPGLVRCRTCMIEECHGVQGVQGAKIVGPWTMTWNHIGMNVMGHIWNTDQCQIRYDQRRGRFT